MAAKNFIKVALVTLLTIALVICAMPMAFAAEDTAAEMESTADTAADTTVDTAEDTADTTADTVADTAEDTAAAGEDSAADTTETSDESAGAEEDESGISTGTIVSIAIVAVIVIAAAVYCIKNKEKVAKFFREVRSECKKIVWTPAKTVKKNTIVVLVIMIVCVIVIAALDLLFSKGIVWLGNII